MRVGNFSLLIPEGVERDSGHVCLPHGTQYRLQLGNNSYTHRCDVQVSIDGKDVGTYRLEHGGGMTLERSHFDQGRFTFFKSGTAEAAEAGAADVSREDKGLVTAVFKPERRQLTHRVLDSAQYTSRSPLRTRGGPCGQSMGGEMKSLGFAPSQTESGVTGLTGNSDQRFTTMANLDYDPALEVTISVRLVHDAAVKKVRKLEPVQSRVPVPVD